MKQETNDDNFEDHFTFLIEEKQNDESLQQKIKDENQDFSIERIREKIKDDFVGTLIEEVFLYKRYKRFAELPDNYTTKEYEYYLKYVEYLEYVNDDQLNEFIMETLDNFTMFFIGTPQTKDRPNPTTIDKVLKYLFLKNILTKNYNYAVVMLSEKHIYNDEYDKYMKELNLMHNESSITDIDTMLTNAIKLKVNDKKVDITKLKIYLKKEILLRIKNYNYTDFSNEIIKEIEENISMKLKKALKNGELMETFWDSF